MSEKRTLFIELFQSFAQYRNPFTFYYAQTYPLPPKSTVIGMLQNVTGRYYDERFWNLKVSIHGGFENIIWNYQNLIKGAVSISKVGLLNKHDGNPLGGNVWHPLYHSNIKAQRTPVYQQELFNGHLYIFLRGEEDVIEEIKSSLERPKKILSIGRSEDVAYIRKVSDDLEIKKKVAKKSLWLMYPTYIRREIKENTRERKEFPIKNQKYPVYSIPILVRFCNNGVPVENKAEITKETERKVKFETVIYTGYDYILKFSESISYEEFEIEGKRFRIISGFGWL